MEVATAEKEPFKWKQIRKLENFIKGIGWTTAIFTKITASVRFLIRKNFEYFIAY